MNLKITARKQSGFDDKITITLPWKPPGIGAPNTVDIPKGQNEVIMTINANGDAPLGDWQIVTTATANTPKGPVRLSSNFGQLRVSEPYLNLAIQMAATEPGKNTSLIAKIEKLKDFAGNAKAILHALPHGVSTSEKQFNQSSPEITFPLEVKADARKGKHANLFCQVIVTENGHPIPHNVGHGGTLRIDPPPPAPKKPKTAVAKNDKPKPQAAAPKKPLSRLEQLRQNK